MDNSDVKSPVFVYEGKVDQVGSIAPQLRNFYFILYFPLKYNYSNLFYVDEALLNPSTSDNTPENGNVFALEDGRIDLIPLSEADWYLRFPFDSKVYTWRTILYNSETNQRASLALPKTQEQFAKYTERMDSQSKDLSSSEIKEQDVQIMEKASILKENDVVWVEKEVVVRTKSTITSKRYERSSRSKSPKRKKSYDSRSR